MHKLKFEYHESELRLSGGKISLQRSLHEQGTWESKGKLCLSRTLQCRPNHFGRKKIDNIKSYFGKYSYARISYLMKIRSIVSTENSFSPYTVQGIYIEIRDRGLIFTKFFEDLFEIEESIEEWLESIDVYFLLESPTQNIDVKILKLSPLAFGFLIHECLGHRLESDDFKDQIYWNKFKPTNFDVFDGPGDSAWWGFTPYGDDGTIGSKVKIFNGADGETSLLAPETGNLRSVNFKFHPIVRQRCLEVETHIDLLPPTLPTLLIEDIRQGSFFGESVVLESSKQIIEDGNGHKYRLPPLRLTFSLNDILGFSAFGEQFINSPSAGCVKGIQKDLPVTFFTPSAWSFLDETQNKIKIEAL